MPFQRIFLWFAEFNFLLGEYHRFVLKPQLYYFNPITSQRKWYSKNSILEYYTVRKSFLQFRNLSKYTNNLEIIYSYKWLHFFKILPGFRFCPVYKGLTHIKGYTAIKSSFGWFWPTHTWNQILIWCYFWPFDAILYNFCLIDKSKFSNFREKVSWFQLFVYIF